MLKMKQIISGMLIVTIMMSLVGILPAKAQSNDTSAVYEHKGYTVEYTVKSAWENGQTVEVEITNTGTESILNWAIWYETRGEISELSNVSVHKEIENGYILKNTGYNYEIAPNQSVNFGYTLTGDYLSKPDVFELISKRMVKDKGYEVSYKVTDDWGAGFQASISITNMEDEPIEAWMLSFDSSFKIGNVWSARVLENKGNGYAMGSLAWSNPIPADSTVNFGFTGTKDPESEATVSNLVLTEVVIEEEINWEDPTDSDDDGIPDVYEIYSYRTAPYDSDTDGDGLDDLFEILNGLNPLQMDSDGNGITDGDEDFDGDGLTNLEERFYKTNLRDDDTDVDGLKDRDEIEVYFTAPLLYDTDKDGLSDGDEIQLKLDPRNADSDKNGISDCDEKIEQTKCLKIDEADKREIDNVTVTMSIAGNINSNTVIENMYQKDMLSSDVAGIIGVPVAITSTASFDKAEITFHYNETLLGETKETDLAVMWYDEENNLYRILDEDSVVDTQNNTVSYVATHFSTYLVVDRQEWYEAWKNQRKYVRIPILPEIPFEYFDVAYVIDRSGSMRGSRITMAKEAITSFVTAMYDADRGALISFESTARVDAGFKETKEKLVTSLGEIIASGGTNVNAGLNKALDEFNTLDSKNAHQMIVLLCDGDVNCTEETLRRAVSMGIRIYPVLIGSSYGSADLQNIADKTGGIFYYAKTAEEIGNALFGIQSGTVGSDDTTDTDGDGLYDCYESSGMMVSNGQYIFSNPLKADTDGDGLSDGQEMGALENYEEQSPVKQVVMNFAGFDSEIYAQYFDYKSNPNLKDSDADDCNDKEDASPLVKNEEINYIYYYDDDDFLEDEALHRTKKLRKEGRKVELITVDSVDGFVMRWNGMALNEEGKIEYSISDVYTICHGGPEFFAISMDDQDFTVWMVGRLHNKKIDTLNLSSCNNGNLDFINDGSWGGIEFHQNIAITIMKQCSGIKTVKAWDGVATYEIVFGNAFEFSSRFSNVLHYFGLQKSNFDKWSIARNQRVREAGQLITYTRESDGTISYSPVYKLYVDLDNITPYRVYMKEAIM